VCRSSDGLNGMISALLSIGQTGNFGPSKSDETIREGFLTGDSVGDVVCLVETIRYPKTAQLRKSALLGENSDDFNDASRIVPL